LDADVISSEHFREEGRLRRREELFGENRHKCGAFVLRDPDRTAQKIQAFSRYQ